MKHIYMTILGIVSFARLFADPCDPPKELQAQLHNPTWYSVHLNWQRPDAESTVAPLRAGTAIYSNGPIITHPGQGANGSDVSVRTSQSMTTGGDFTKRNNKSLADEFELNAATSIEFIDFFAYHSGHSDIAVTPYNAVYVKIFNHKPTASSVPVWGDFVTNILSESSFAGIYRVFDATALLNVDRPVYKIRAAINTVLQPGTYWLEVTAGSTYTTVGADYCFAVPVTKVGEANLGNAIQRFSPTGSYTDWKDTNGKNGAQGLSFEIYGTASDPIAGYNVYRDNVKLNEEVLKGRTYTDLLPPVAGTHIYKVTAVWQNDCESNPDTLKVEMEQNPCEIARTTFPLFEGFEDARLPDCWSEVCDEDLTWEYRAGAYGNTNPYGALSGALNAYLMYDVISMPSTPLISKMVTPMMDISGLVNPTLTFYHAQGIRYNRNDELRVYYKTSQNGEWMPLAAYPEASDVWVKRSMLLPEASETYWIAFEGRMIGGRGVVLDNIQIDGTTCEKPLNGQYVAHSPSDYEVTLSWQAQENDSELRTNTMQSSVLFDNGTMITESKVGYTERDISEVAVNNISFFGSSTQINNVTTSIADDFTMTENGYIGHIDLYPHHVSVVTTNTITGVYIKIYDAAPNAGGKVIWGNFVDNLLESSQFAGIYRTAYNNKKDNARPVMHVKAFIGKFFPAGTYWMEVTYSGDEDKGVYSSPVNIVPEVTHNALRYTNKWEAWKSNSTPIGVPFKVYGALGVTSVTGHNIYRDGVKINAQLITTQIYTDTVPSVVGSYEYGITNVRFNGCESEPLKIQVNIAEPSHTGMGDISAVNVSVYPNPVDKNEWITVENNLPDTNSSAMYAEIYDTTGRLLNTQSFHTGVTRIKAPAVSGLYILKIYSNDKMDEFKIKVK